MDTGLASWNDGPIKSVIREFVVRVTERGGPDFVPLAERIATFDNDGTLWCEWPQQVQFCFGHERLQALVARDPSLKKRQPFKAYLERDMAAIHQLGKRGLFEVAAAEHAGMTADAFDHLAEKWLATATHPSLGVPYTQLVYRPQIDLMAYLRANGFTIFIVSGGGVDLIRAFAEEVYGVARAQVIGSSVKTRFEMRNGHGVLVKLAELNSFDDREAKVENIGLHIGRRPILAFGNSDGDLAMLRYVRTGKGPRLSLLLHHDDAEREFSYDREFHFSPLAEALDNASAYGLNLVSMKRDWKIVFESRQDLKGRLQKAS